MPRQRSRRRRQVASAQAQPSRAPARERRASTAAAPSTSNTQAAIRSRWIPTLGVAFAFFLGLWLGGLLSVTDTASGVTLLVGVVGLGLTGARMLRHWIEARRVRAIREHRDRQTQLADQEDRRRRYSVPRSANQAEMEESASQADTAD